MVKIRYADLPGGLHARAETDGRHAIIYLRPGLTPAQRRESLRRARQSARMGYGPSLPAAAVQAALARDRVRITMRNAIAAVYQHPGSSAVLAGLLSAAVACYVMFVSVSITFIHAPPSPAQVPRPGHVGMAPPAVGSGPAQGGQRGADAPGPPAPGPGRRSKAGATSTPSPRASGPSPQPTAVPSPVPSPTPSPVPSPSPSGACLNVGPLGVCLSL